MLMRTIFLWGTITKSQEFTPGRTDGATLPKDVCEDSSDVCLLQLKQHAASSSTISTGQRGSTSVLATGMWGVPCEEACKGKGHIVQTMWGPRTTAFGPCDFCWTGGLCCATTLPYAGKYGCDSFWKRDDQQPSCQTPEGNTENMEGDHRRRRRRDLSKKSGGSSSPRRRAPPPKTCAPLPRTDYSTGSTDLLIQLKLKDMHAASNVEVTQK